VVLARLHPEALVAWALQRQHLTAGTAGGGLLPVMEDLLGLHATVPASPYLQVRARLRDFTPADLDTVLDAGRAVRIGGMRRTLFIEPVELVPLVLAATRQVSSRRGRSLTANGVTPARYHELAGGIEDVLRGRAMTVRELGRALGVDERLSPVVNAMCDESRLLRWRGSRGWRSGRPAYRRFAEVLPSVHLGGGDEAGAVTGLVQRYVRRYGPVTEADIAWWTGLRRSTVRSALASLPGLLLVTVDGLDGELLLDETDLHAARERAGPVGELCMLPALDPYLQSHADRSRFVQAAHLPYVVDRGGNATSVILRGGRAVGVWDYFDAPAPQMRLLLFDPASAGTRRRVRQAAEALGAFLAGEEPPVLECTDMPPLTRSAGAFLSPLRHAR
jgi:hypothetical protein